jgi:hypothetical protein
MLLGRGAQYALLGRGAQYARGARTHAHARGLLRALVSRVVSYSKSTSLTSKGHPAHSKISPLPAT